ncbi:MAG: hypothetical protein WC139_00275 [Candidatus Kapaibacterium sp.]
MKHIIIFLFSFVLLTGCGQKKEEVKITKTDEPIKEAVEEKKLTTETESIEETETQEETVTKPEKKTSAQYVNLKSSETAGNKGSNAVVTGYVADVVVREKVAYLNFDSKYPKNTFTAVIFPDKFEVFGDLMDYKNKTVEVKGKIGEFNGKPQIILNNKSQLKVVN